jgi:hypothetical protein
MRCWDPARLPASGHPLGIIRDPALCRLCRARHNRHTCASWLVMRGRSLKEVQEILGHRKFSMTLRYAHPSPDRLRDTVATLEDFSTESAHGAKIDPDRRVSPSAPVAQVDRAAVS